jgi:hypothetical protein
LSATAPLVNVAITGIARRLCVSLRRQGQIDVKLAGQAELFVRRLRPG